jgi:hypothetical protein
VGRVDSGRPFRCPLRNSILLTMIKKIELDGKVFFCKSERIIAEKLNEIIDHLNLMNNSLVYEEPIHPSLHYHGNIPCYISNCQRQL